MENDYSIHIKKLIIECPFLSGISQETIEVLAKNLEMISISSGGILFYQGDISEYFYIVSTGKLSALLTKLNGEKAIVGHLLPNEPVGELGAFLVKPHSLTIIADEDSTLYRLPSHIFREICDKNPSIIVNMKEIIVGRSWSTLRSMAYESKNINVVLIYANSQDHVFLKNKFLSLNEPNLLFILSNKVEIDKLETIISDASVNKINLIFFMEDWDESFFNAIKKCLSHYVTLIHESERDLTNLSKKIIYDIKHMPSIRSELGIIHPPLTNKISNTRKWLDKGDFILHHHLRINEENDFNRFIRFMTGKAVGLVLGGGGARGLCHLGVIKAILDSKIQIDAIGGTSIGSAISACYALQLNYHQLLTFMRQLKPSSIKSLRFMNMVWPIISIFSSDPATSLLIHLMNNTLIEDLPIPYFAMVSDIKHKKGVALKEGFIWQAVRGSVAIPGLFPPVTFDGNIYADGGLINNLPVESMRELIGSKNIIIASSLSRRGGENKHFSVPTIMKLKKSLLLSLGFKKHKYSIPPFFDYFVECLLLGSAEREEYNAKLANILVRPDLTDFKTFSFKTEKDEDRLIEKGYEEAIKSINEYYSII